MKVIGIVGSPRKNGNTEMITNHALKAIAEEGLETESVWLGGLEIKPCTGCMVCKKGEQCSIEDDDLFPLYLKMKDADGIVLASPVYFGSATANIKALMDRAGFISRQQENNFSGKVGGALVVARRAGANFTFAQLNFWFQILGMVVPGSTYWNIGYGSVKGEIMKDEEGLKTAWNFGKNMAHVIKKLRS